MRRTTGAKPCTGEQRRDTSRCWSSSDSATLTTVHSCGIFPIKVALEPSPIFLRSRFEGEQRTEGVRPACYLALVAHLPGHRRCCCLGGGR